MIAETAFLDKFQNGEAPAAHVYFFGLEVQTWVELIASTLIEGFFISFLFYLLGRAQSAKDRRHLQAELKMLEHNMKRNNAELHQMKERSGKSGI